MIYSKRLFEAIKSIVRCDWVVEVRMCNQYNIANLITKNMKYMKPKWVLKYRLI